MAVDPKFIINLKGKEFVLLAGLLDLAHGQGLRSIETELVPELCNVGEKSYVARAIGRFRTETGEDAIWSAYGDAAPGNSQMRGAELRHAETRAIARMLRFATNVGMTAFDELPPSHDVQDHQAAEPYVAQPRTSPKVRHEGTADSYRQERANGSACSWKDCGERLSTAEAELTTRQFGRLLCGAHADKVKDYPRCEDCNAVVVPAKATASKAQFQKILCQTHALEAGALMSRLAASPAA